MSDLLKVSLSTNQRTQLRRRLMTWFHQNHRDYPWRQNRDPYAIWVSEVMLQQTQVTAVIPFFVRFLARFPTIQKLAEASEQDVLRHWEGLGYYRRARHLHRAARMVVAEHAGKFPQTFEQASALPGLGRYTVGAILSQAFDQPWPVVDANVARVLCRLLAWPLELELRSTQTWLWQTAEHLLPGKDAGNFNQALMELGQTVCTTGQPSCLLCPLRDLCQGLATGQAGVLPRRQAKLTSTKVRELAILLHKGQQVLLCQRKPDASRWANMWEFPTLTLTDNVKPLEGATEQCLALTGYHAVAPKTVGSLQYGITRFAVTLDVVKAQWQRGRPHFRAYQKLIWLQPSQLSDYPLSVPHRRLAQRWLHGE